MKFKTLRTSETGKKLQSICDKWDVIHEQQKEVGLRYGFTNWRIGHFCAFGGFSSIIFDEKPDTKNWKLIYYPNEYLPKLNSKIGKQIQKDLDSIETIPFLSLNRCIGYEERFNKIGFTNKGESEYFGLVIREEWVIDMPSDCEEITNKEFNELFHSDIS